MGRHHEPLPVVPEWVTYPAAGVTQTSPVTATCACRKVRAFCASMNNNRANFARRLSGKCFDHGGKVGPLATGINDGRQEGFGGGADAHTNPSLFG